MGKRIGQQARGRGGPAYRVRRAGYKYKVRYLPNMKGKATVMRLINSAGHNAPLAKLMIDSKIFINVAGQGVYEGQEIEVGGEGMETGDIVLLKQVPIGTKIFNIEKRPGDGGKMVRSSGGYAVMLKKDDKGVVILMLNKKEIRLHPECRATIGIVAGQGRVIKPIRKAGKKYKMMKSVGRLWHRTSAVKVNAVDHPFGGGRGKRIKSKIAKRNAAPGKKVGHILPRRTGKKKR